MLKRRSAGLVLLPALVLALSLAFTATAPAQTPFQAGVTLTNTLPFAKAGGCSNGAYYCGTANIAGYGTASWNFYLTGATISQTSCGSTYQATTDFTLASDPGSTLVLDEAGAACGPGLNANGYFKEGSTAYGHPNSIVGSWTVDPASSGQFSGLTGSGTDQASFAGAHGGGSYSGTLG
jgi:hypothetical protein